MCIRKEKLNVSVYFLRVGNGPWDCSKKTFSQPFTKGKGSHGDPSRLRLAYHLLEVGSKLQMFCNRIPVEKHSYIPPATRYKEGTPLTCPFLILTRKTYFASW